MDEAPEGEVDSEHVAYLTDRVLVGEGKPQRYGTQLENKDGNLTPYPLEDPETVDERRRAVGMSPLAEYLKFAEEGQRRLAHPE